MNVPVPENGVAPESVRVPVWAPVAKLRVAVAPPAVVVNATVPPTLTEPEPRLNTALFNLDELDPSLPVIARLPVIDKVEIVEVSVVVLVLLGVTFVVPPTVRDAEVIVPVPVIVAAVLAAAAFWSVMLVVTVSTAPEFTVNVVELVLELSKVSELNVVLPETSTEVPAVITTGPENSRAEVARKVCAALMVVVPVVVMEPVPSIFLLAPVRLMAPVPLMVPSTVRIPATVSVLDPRANVAPEAMDKSAVRPDPVEVVSVLAMVIV